MALGAMPLKAQQYAAPAPPPALLQSVGIAQEMNQQVPGDLAFRDENGKSVRLGDYFGSKPIVLSLVYFNCPFICTDVLNGQLRAMQGMSLVLGKDYQAVTVSFDPKDGQPDASYKSHLYTGMYGPRATAGGWHFLTGDQQAITALTNAVGFHYAYDQQSQQFAHATAIMILTPQGRVARYFYGVEYPSRDVRLGLVEASEGKIGTPTDAALLFCYHYDPLTGKYGIVVSNVMKIAGGLTVLFMGIFLWVMFRSEKYRPISAEPLYSGAGHPSMGTASTVRGRKL
jgi:protein SCO1/2